ncbi:hypothetical protein BDZ88DRAFT_417284 [Geranomyces variabilis]|nr:hypothetical protein BDZ88DRAFT_417284 [Geranomyces variabilis]
MYTYIMRSLQSGTLVAARSLDSNPNIHAIDNAPASPCNNSQLRLALLRRRARQHKGRLLFIVVQVQACRELALDARVAKQAQGKRHVAFVLGRLQRAWLDGLVDFESVECGHKFDAFVGFAGTAGEQLVTRVAWHAAVTYAGVIASHVPKDALFALNAAYGARRRAVAAACCRLTREKGYDRDENHSCELEGAHNLLKLNF